MQEFASSIGDRVFIAVEKHPVSDAGGELLLAARRADAAALDAAASVASTHAASAAAKTIGQIIRRVFGATGKSHSRR